MTELSTIRRQWHLWEQFRLAERQARDEGIVDKAEIVAFIKKRLGPLGREDRLAILEWVIRRQIVTGRQPEQLDLLSPDQEDAGG